MNLWSDRFSQNMNQILYWISAMYCPTLQGQKSLQFLVHILGETMTSQIHSEIYWPLVGFEKKWGWGNNNKLSISVSDLFSNPENLGDMVSITEKNWVGAVLPALLVSVRLWSLFDVGYIQSRYVKNRCSFLIFISFKIF